MISSQKLDQYIKHNQNVLFKGPHGVGKTAVVIDAFERNNLKWLYYSTSTMDPWVDMIGVPKEKIDKNGRSYLELVRPEAFANDTVEAIFLDEFNRSSKKVRNAVMELIQFKSINGKKFKNLKVVWAAINPDDEDPQKKLKYDVEPLDPAQIDRFHIHLEFPNRPDAAFFTKKYGKAHSSAAIEWWKAQANPVREAISPRRLDYVLNAHKLGLDLRDLLPASANVTQLTFELENGPIKDTLEEIFQNKQVDEAKKILKNDKMFTSVLMLISSMPTEKFEFFVSNAESEKVSLLLSKPEVSKKILNNYELIKVHKKTLQDICSVNPNSSLSRKIKNVLKTSIEFSDKYFDQAAFINSSLIKPTVTEHDALLFFDRKFLNDMKDTASRFKMFTSILGFLPEKINYTKYVNSNQLRNGLFSMLSRLIIIGASTQRYSLQNQFHSLVPSINHMIRLLSKEINGNQDITTEEFCQQLVVEFNFLVTSYSRKRMKEKANKFLSNQLLYRQIQII